MKHLLDKMAGQQLIHETAGHLRAQITLLT